MVRAVRLRRKATGHHAAVDTHLPPAPRAITTQTRRRPCRGGHAGHAAPGRFKTLRSPHEVMGHGGHGGMSHGARGSRQARPTPRCHAYLRMVTGVPSGSVRARMAMAPLSKRTQPLDTSRPRSLGSAVPCNASWPSPVPNCSSTSE
jgi:hypothetical protein